MAYTGSNAVIVSFIFSFLIVLLCGLTIIFIYEVLIPAMKQLSLYVGETLFAADEMTVPVFRTEQELLTCDKKAVVLCSHAKQFTGSPFTYAGTANCRIFAAGMHSYADCPFSCCGLGDCAKACPENAVAIVNRTAVIADNCTGCGVCVSVCPRALIRLVPRNEKITLFCAASRETVTTCSQYLRHTDEIPVLHRKPPVIHRIRAFISRRRHTPMQEDKPEQGDMIE